MVVVAGQVIGDEEFDDNDVGMIIRENCQESKNNKSTRQKYVKNPYDDAEMLKTLPNERKNEEKSICRADAERLLEDLLNNQDQNTSSTSSTSTENKTENDTSTQRGITFYRDEVSRFPSFELSQSSLDTKKEKYGGYSYVELRFDEPSIENNKDSDSELQSDDIYVGLVNQAMTCYLNSLLQALYMTPEFRNALYNWEYVEGSEKDESNSIPYQLQKLFLNLQTSTKYAVETTALTKSFGWDSTEAWQQHDIQELCRVMLDSLEQKFKNTEQADLINRLYEGKMIDYVKCLECKNEKIREDTFLDIPLPVRPFGSNVAYNSVEEAIQAFVQPEILEGANQYFCETCNKKCNAHKGLKFTKFPYLLTLHLKRFDFDYNTFHRIKLNDKVTFPDMLNLNSFITATTTSTSLTSSTSSTSTSSISTLSSSTSTTPTLVPSTSTTSTLTSSTSSNTSTLTSATTTASALTSSTSTTPALISSTSTTSASTSSSLTTPTLTSSTTTTSASTSSTSATPTLTSTSTTESNCQPTTTLEDNINCVDNSITDNGKKVSDVNNVDDVDDGLPSDNGVTSSSDAANSSSDDGIDVGASNYPSTSQHHQYHECNNRNGGNDNQASGPYQYELFSIMIHSGGAGGGHYYAYIKDFKSHQWRCFNDTNVSMITCDDIQRTYGGGPSRAYYNGAYSSSTSAYMLMYRQIDPERNALPMRINDFPQHLQGVLTKMKDDDNKSHKKNFDIQKVKIYCDHPVDKKLLSIKFFVYDEILSIMLEKAYKEFNLSDVVDLDKCRLVAYNPLLDIIECSFEGYENKYVCEVLTDFCLSKQANMWNMLLEIREKNEKFKVYLPDEIVTKVFLINLLTRKIEDGPIIVRALQSMTILEYKKLLNEHFNRPPGQQINTVLLYHNTYIIDNDYDELENAGFYSGCKVFAANKPDMNATFNETVLKQIVDSLQHIVLLNVHLPNVGSDTLEQLNIPSLEMKLKDKESDRVTKSVINSESTSTSSTSTSISTPTTTSVDTLTLVSSTMTATTSTSTLSTSTSSISSTLRPDKSDAVPNVEVTVTPTAENLSTAVDKKPDDESSANWNGLKVESDEWTQERSNSEDSSLSDSDKTLVGDASEDDEVCLISVVKDEFFDFTKNFILDDSNGEGEFFFQLKKKSGQSESSRFIQVLVDKRITINSLQKYLEPHVKVPVDYFKIERPSIDLDRYYTRRGCRTENKNFEDGEKIVVKLYRVWALREDEFTVHVLHMFESATHSHPQVQHLVMEWIISDKSTVGEVKREIINELYKNFSIYISYDKCRLREFNCIPSTIYLDDQKVKDTNLRSANEVIIQELEDDEVKKNPNQIVIALKYHLNDDIYLEVAIDTPTVEELRCKLEELTDLPAVNLEVKEGSFWKHDEVCTDDWTPATANEWPIKFEDGAILIYRETDVAQDENSKDESRSRYAINPDTKRFIHISKRRNRRSTLRRDRKEIVIQYRRPERALKIHVDNK